MAQWYEEKELTDLLDGDAHSLHVQHLGSVAEYVYVELRETATSKEDKEQFLQELDNLFITWKPDTHTDVYNDNLHALLNEFLF